MASRARMSVKGSCPQDRHFSAIGKDRQFGLNIKILVTRETFPIKNISNDMKIPELKAITEYSTGIPSNIHRLFYLDEGDLMEFGDVRSYDIVPGGTLKMKVWRTWQTLVEAVAANELDTLFHLGVTENSDYATATSDYMHFRTKKEWLAERGFVALFVAAHRGNMKMCKELLSAGINVNGHTALGRTALHVAAVQGHGHMVDLLLQNGADIDAVDKSGENALAAARRYDRKDCERHLFLFRWQQRAAHIKVRKQRNLFHHQVRDSVNPIWLKGSLAQLYFAQVQPPVEFQGSNINSRHTIAYQKKHQVVDDVTELETDEERSSWDSTSSGGSCSQKSSTRRSKKNVSIKISAETNKTSFEEWLGKKEVIRKAEAQAKLDAEEAKAEAKAKKKLRIKSGNKDDPTNATREAAPTPAVSRPGSQKKQVTIGQQSQQSVALANKHIIKLVMQRREKELRRRGIMTYDEWLDQTDGQILEQIRAGQTPLEPMIQHIIH